MSSVLSVGAGAVGEGNTFGNMRKACLDNAVKCGSLYKITSKANLTKGRDAKP